MGLSLEKQKISKAIIQGTNYLFEAQMDDGGIKFEDEFCNRSGIWVTAEALEFLLKSKIVPVTTYPKIKRMIDFLIANQHTDGSWSVLIESDTGGGPTEKLGSAIATGHAVYALRLAANGDYLDEFEQNKINVAIENGKKWLKGCMKSYGNYTFWPSSYVSEQLNPHKNEKARMEFVFSTFYAVMAFLPIGISRPAEDVQILNRTKEYYVSQADWFCKEYKNKKHTEDEISKAASTICRIACALYLLFNSNIPERLADDLKVVLSSINKNPFRTTSVSVNTIIVKQSAEDYNNNTPFDMGMALLSLESDAKTIKTIIDKYVEEQQVNGSWYLNFSKVFTVNTWTTSEALLVLEKALDKYDEIVYYEEVDALNKKVVELTGERDALEEENLKLKNKVPETEYIKAIKKLKRSAITSRIISIVLSIVIIVYLISWYRIEGNAETTIGTYSNFFIFPLALNIVVALIKSVKDIIGGFKNGEVQ